MKNLLTYLIILIVAAGCSNEPFDSNKWKEQGLDWYLTDVRENMLSDIINSDTLIDMSNPQIIQLLGEPEEMSSKEYKYLVKEKYGSDIDPEYIKYLIVNFDERGKVINVEVKN